MTNREFLDTLVVTGELDLGELEKDSVTLENIREIRNYHKYIGGVYLKLLKLHDIKMEEILRTIRIIMIGFDLSYEEMDIVIKRFEIMHDIMDKGYVSQIVNLYIQLRNFNKLVEKGVSNLDRKEVLYTCRVVPSISGLEHFNRNGNMYSVYFKETIIVKEILHRKVYCRDLKYIILSDESLEFIEEENLERDRYKFRVTYWRGNKSENN